MKHPFSRVLLTSFTFCSTLFWFREALSDENLEGQEQILPAQDSLSIQDSVNPRLSDESFQCSEEALPSSCCDRIDSASDPMIELKVGYFIFSDSRMRKVYDKGGIDLQLSSAFPICKWLQIYASCEFFQRSGKSLNLNENTSIWGVPLNLGLRSIFEISERSRYYLSAGPRYTFIQAHNQSSYVPHHVNNSAVGGFVNTGFSLDFLRN